MADRRMFAIAVINSAKFLRMPTAARLLYYDLGMRADDDGIVEAFSVLRTTNADEANLNILAEKGFVEVLNDELVTYITDWSKNNFIRKDRYKPSIYKHLISAKEDDNQMSTKGLPNDNQWSTQYRLGKDSIGKESIVEVREEKGSEVEDAESTPRPHGRFSNVFLTDSEFSQLKKDFSNYESAIEGMSAHMAETGKTYNNHYVRLCKWAREDMERALNNALQTTGAKTVQAKEPKEKHGTYL